MNWYLTGEIGNYIWELGGDERVLDVLRGPLVGREQLVQLAVQPGPLQQRDHRRRTLIY